MTTRERTLKYITEFNAEFGFSPSVREIAKAVYICSTSTIHSHLQRMEKDGLIKRKNIRCIEVIGVSSEVEIIKYHKDVPSVINWQGRRYVMDMR